jgi:hypothetical protein
MCETSVRPSVRMCGGGGGKVSTTKPVVEFS